MFKKIVLFTLPWLCLLGVFRLVIPNNSFLPHYDDIITKIARLPNLYELLIIDLNECKQAFMSIPHEWIWNPSKMPSFDASSIGEFFASIGRFLTAYTSSFFNFFFNFFNILVSFINALTVVAQTILNTLVNVVTYILGVLDIIFGH